MTKTSPEFDRRAAVTRSLLGWGVVAGIFYVAVGLILAFTRDGFDLIEHPLSVLALGEGGWMHRANLVISGLMVLAAAYGITRAIRSGRGLAIGTLTAVFGAGLILSAVFPPDPVGGFPDDMTAQATTSGVLHLVFGGLGFIALAGAAAAYAAWTRAEPAVERSLWAIALAALVVLGFLGGGALSGRPIGVGLLWIAVLAGWLWLALASARLYRFTPHPDTGERR